MNSGYIYIATNPAFQKDLLEIGATTKNPTEHAKKLLTKDTPVHFHVAYKIGVLDCGKAENLIHDNLKRYRHSKDREFYKIPLEEAIQKVNEVAEQVEDFCQKEQINKKIEQFDRVEKNIELFKKLVKEYPHYTPFYFYLSKKYDEIGFHKLAIEAKYKGTRIAEKNIAYYKDEIRYNPNDVDLYFEMANQYKLLDHHTEVIKSYKAAVSLSPNDAKAHLLLGESYINWDLIDEAIEVFEKIRAVDINELEQGSMLADCLMMLGRYYAEMGQYQKAIEVFKDGAIFDPDNERFYDLLGTLYIEIGLYDKAIESYEEIIDLSDYYPGISYNLGNAYLLAGNQNAALEQYETLKNLDSELADELYSKIYSQDESVKIQCRKFEGQYFVPVSVSGKDGTAIYNMLLDTGASTTFISLEAARKTGNEDLDVTNRKTFYTANGEMSCPIVSRKISVFNINKDLSVAVNENDEMNLLGMDFFQGQKYIIDSSDDCIYLWRQIL